MVLAFKLSYRELSAIAEYYEFLSLPECVMTCSTVLLYPFAGK